MNKPNIQALIFDMDGVLVDSEPMHLASYQEILGTYGIPYSEEDNREFLGRKDLEILQVLHARHGLPESPESLLTQKEDALARLLADSQPRPGLLTVLKQARALNISLAVASSATLPTIHLVVDTLLIRDYFVTLASGDEVKEGKPAPDVFLLAAARLGVLPEYCLVVEDTFNGVKAAKAAGMHCVAIPCDTTRHQDHSQADLQLDSLEQLNLAAWVGDRPLPASL